jgi:hypothetical protein
MPPVSKAEADSFVELSRRTCGLDADVVAKLAHTWDYVTTRKVRPQEGFMKSYIYSKRLKSFWVSQMPTRDCQAHSYQRLHPSHVLCFLV